MKRAAVLGSPIGHSLSPFIHNRAYEILGFSGEYEKFDVKNEELETFIARKSTDEWIGFSLTMPLKESIFDLGLEIDKRAKKLRTANTLLRDGNTFKALSTDVLAFERILGQLEFTSVASSGGGGTARAALGSLDGKVAAVTILQRDNKRNELLSACADSSHLTFADMKTSLESFDLVISTTPSGVSDTFVPTISSSTGTLIEVLYKPWPTSLASAWAANGGRVIHGLDLLVEQALDQITLMTNMRFDYESMRETLLADVLTHNRGL